MSKGSNGKRKKERKKRLKWKFVKGDDCMPQMEPGWKGDGVQGGELELHPSALTKNSKNK